MDPEENGSPESTAENLHTSHIDAAENETSGKDIIEGQPGDDAAAATTDWQAPAKPKQTVQERIDEVTRQKHELAREKDRDIEYWKAKALQAPQSQPAHEAPQAPQGDGRPDPAEYEGGYQNPEFIEDLTDWKAEQAAERLSARSRQQEQAKSARESFETRAKTIFPDGDSPGLKTFKQIPQLPVAVIEIVGDSDVGPKIAEHLGDNPAELARLERLSPIQQARELTRLEQRFATPAKPTLKNATDAPEPAPQARGAGGQFKVDPATSDFEAFEKLADAKG